jgi:hypothetical protein
VCPAHPRTALPALASLVLSLAGTLAVARCADPGQPYTVAAVQAGLVHQPGFWLGRTVQMCGVAVISGCVVIRESMLCMNPTSEADYLLDPTTLVCLPLTMGAASSLLSLLRRLPLFGMLAPAAQAPHWGELAT